MSNGLISIELDTRQRRQLKAYLRRIGKRARPVFRNAISRSATRVRREVIKAVKGEITLDARRINAQVKVTKRPRVNDLRGIVTVLPARRLPALTDFSGVEDNKVIAQKIRTAVTTGRQDRRFKKRTYGGGVSFTIRKGGGQENAPRAFLAMAASGKVLALTRFSAGRELPGRRLRALTGPTVAGVFEGSPGMAQRVLRDADKVLLEQTLEGVRKELAKRQ